MVSLLNHEGRTIQPETALKGGKKQPKALIQNETSPNPHPKVRIGGHKVANVTISTTGAKSDPVFFARFPSIPALGARTVERALFTLLKNIKRT